MHRNLDPNAPWFEFIDRKRRHNFLAILEELSSRQSKEAPEFILIGALVLLMQNYLHYLAWWDIDLLFRDSETLQGFANAMKAPGLKIKQIDDEMIRTHELECLHVMWSFGRTWANVDYIYRPSRFQFFYETLRHQEPFAQTVRLDHREYQLSLYLGNPWDIFVDKLTLSRLTEQLKKDDFLGKDFRHLFFILQRDHANDNFWKHLAAKSEALGQKEILKAAVIRLIEIAPELGYEDVGDRAAVVKFFGEF
ncbi:MAG: hypothetical protein ONB44_05185 [candidate division KSB1 bacterium]|nr:hypothetical protein [candidate division KSB1 bacterium]MDZ7301517.1 hypothetical protein [candidate division KSB1 bacterium]MDZ7311067.1 hypothetical protein [candidate division KSB1 bacterium]